MSSEGKTITHTPGSTSCLATIKKLDGYGDDMEGGASVLVEINGAQLWTFCHPCDFVEGETALVEFGVLSEESIEEFFNKNVDSVKKIVPTGEQDWEYHCYGKVLSIHPVIVDCGVFIFDYGDWLNDDRVIGHYVYSEIWRLDVSRV